MKFTSYNKVQHRYSHFYLYLLNAWVAKMCQELISFHHLLMPILKCGLGTKRQNFKTIILQFSKTFSSVSVFSWKFQNDFWKKCPFLVGLALNCFFFPVYLQLGLVLLFWNVWHYSDRCKQNLQFLQQKVQTLGFHLKIQ